MARAESFDILSATVVSSATVIVSSNPSATSPDHDGKPASISPRSAQRLCVAAERSPVEGFGEVLHEVKAVRHLGGLGRARTGAVPIGLQAISGDDHDTGMLT